MHDRVHAIPPDPNYAPPVEEPGDTPPTRKDPPQKRPPRGDPKPPPPPGIPEPEVEDPPGPLRSPGGPMLA